MHNRFGEATIAEVEARETNGHIQGEKWREKNGFLVKKSKVASALGLTELTGEAGDRALEAAAKAGKIGPGAAVLMCIVSITVYAVIGWIFFNHFYGWTFVDCFYFAMVTITTVGYGDLTPADDPAHQMFTGAYAFLGVAIIAGTLSDLSASLVHMVRKVARKAKNEAIMESNMLLAQHSSRKTGLAVKDKFRPTKKRKQRSSVGSRTGFFSEIKSWYKCAKLQLGILVDIKLILLQMFVIWSIGAGILQSTEGFTFVQGFYCSVITSISVGYGDFFPSTQQGRAAFGFYIPLSVTIILGCIHQMMGVAKKFHTVHVIKTEPMTKIFSLDTNGDGEISQSEYVLYMLEEMREVDANLVDMLKSQFDALDSDHSGSLTEGDFPDTLEVQIKTVIYKKHIQSVNWKVVPKEGLPPPTGPAYLKTLQPTRIASRDAQQRQSEPVSPTPCNPPSPLSQRLPAAAASDDQRVLINAPRINIPATEKPVPELMHLNLSPNGVDQTVGRFLV